MSRWRRLATRSALVVGLAALAVGLVLTLGCGHTIGPGIPFEDSPEYDFTQARRCDSPTQPPPPIAGGDVVVVRYFGAGGVYIGWRGEGLLSAPFFSNPSLVGAGFGRVSWSRDVIERGLAHVPVANVGGIFAGHSHYDHIGDLPVVAGKAPRAALLVNASGRNALDPYPELGERVHLLEDLQSRFTQLHDATGRALPFRIYPLASHHAPHLGGIKVSKGTTARSDTPWEQRRWGSLKEGQTYAFVIELTDGTSASSGVRFRLFFQDSASQAPLGVPPSPGPGDLAYDLAILCMASSQFVEPYPEDVLRRIAPRHVLATHYEDFFAPWGARRPFVPLLTRRVANRFLRRVDATLGELHVAGAPPEGTPCGPSTARWTMPLTGEWLLFRAARHTAGHPRSAPARGASRSRR
jgi:L-ascorbate metabolism protein UlaG (beta-lactamase superfamily)